MKPVANLTLMANFATSFASVGDTGGKFATGVNDTGSNLLPVSTTPVAIFHRYQGHRRANLPLVSMTPVANNGNNIRLLRP
jgi:hypothetical protein